MAINFNNGPYYDDFDPDKNFYRVLFKPGYAVQARELNQLQSILQHQISSMGNHLFKKNTMVIPGGITINEKATLIGIDNITDPSVLVGKTITNAPSFDFRNDSTLDDYITAVVLAYRSATSDEPAILYVKYFKTQADGRTYFEAGEQLKTVGSTLITFNVHDTVGSSIGKVATISEGTFYTKQTFVDVRNQSVIVDLNSTETLTSVSVGLAVKESIVTSDDDQSLLDNSIGTPNQYAPGADRYKIELVLESWPLGESPTDDNFIKLIDIEFNIVTYLNNKTQYAELMKMLARRTYDANGNFIVNGLEVGISRSTDDEYLLATVGRGKCYLGGYEFEQLTSKTLTISKPRSEQYQEVAGPVTSFETEMMYFNIAGGIYLKEIPQEETLIQLLDSNPVSITFDPSDISTSGEYIDIPDHGLYTGTPVVYKKASGGTVPGGLVDGQTYYIARVSKDRIKLTTTDLSAGVIGSTDENDSQNIFTVSNFDPTTQIDYTTSILTLADHGYQNGTAVQYKRNTTNSVANTAIGGLTTNTIYYTAVINEDTFYLTATEESAKASRLQVVFNATDATVVDLQENVFTIPDHGFTTGTAVQYSDGGGTVIGGLTDNATYYIVRLTSNTFKLATSKSNAQANPAVVINITSGAAGTVHVLSRILKLSTGATGTNHIFDRCVDLSSQGSGTHTIEKATTVIGHAIFKNIQYSHGVLNRTDVYKMFVENVTLDKGYNLNYIGGFKVIAVSQGAPILHRITVENVTGRFIAGNEIVSGDNPISAGIIYNISNDNIYCIKDANAPVPSAGIVSSILRNSTGAVTNNGNATVKSYFISNFTGLNFFPMIKVHNDTIKTLYHNNEPSLSYSVIRRDEFSFAQGPGEYVFPATLANNQTFEEYSTSNYFAFVTDSGDEQFVSLDDVLELSSTGKSYTLRVGSASPLSGKTSVWVYSTINQVNVSQANKAVTTVTNGFTISTPSKSWMALNHQEIVSVQKIVDGKVISILGPNDDGAVWSNQVATFTTEVNHFLNVGDVVVIKNVKSVNNTTGAFNNGYNGKFVVASIPTSQNVPILNKFTVAIANDPGTLTLQGVVALPPDINYDIDITNRYYLDTGSTEFFHGTGLIKLKKGATPPAGQISVRYTYNQLGTGEYVSVDSYGNYTGDLSYIGDIPDLIGSTKNGLQIRNYIDFRTKTSKFFFKNYGVISAADPAVLVLRDLNLSGMESLLVGKYVVGPSHNKEEVEISSVRFNEVTGNTELILASAASGNFAGIYYIGLKLVNGIGLSLVDSGGGGRSFLYPKDGSKMSYYYTKFMSKSVMIYLNRRDDVITVDQVEVKDISEVNALRKNEFKLPIAYVYLEPYTVDLHNANLKKFDNPVYQMLDIHNLKLRIDRTEYYSSQSLDNKINNIVMGGDDDDRVTRAARGFWNENFMNASAQETEDDDYVCTIYDQSHVSPQAITRTIPLEIVSTHQSSTWNRVGNTVTLPFRSVLAISNTRASRSNNLNPFNVVQWEGKLTLNPAVDNWVDTTIVPPLTSVNTIDIPGTNVFNTINVSGATGPSSSSGSTSPVIDSTTVGGTPNNVVPDQVGSTPPTVLPPVTAPLSMSVPPIRTAAPPIKPNILTQNVTEIVTEVDLFTINGVCWCSCPNHAVGFSWKTNIGRVGRVNTDCHFCPWFISVEQGQSRWGSGAAFAAAHQSSGFVLSTSNTAGWSGYPASIDGSFARSCVGKPYTGLVKQYLNAGRHYDYRSRAQWASFWSSGVEYSQNSWARQGTAVNQILNNDSLNAGLAP